MPYDHFDVVDCDGHIVETVEELAKFMDPATRKHALEPARNREGVFPSLDGFHLALHTGAAVRERVTASDHRPGSADDWLAFLDKAKIDRAVLFTSEGLSVGNIQNPRYAAAICRAYNDYVHETFARASGRLRPMALIAMQDPPGAAAELRRAVRDLVLAGAMIPSTGLPLHLGHEYYRPVYAQAAELGCPLAVHGGANGRVGLETFSNFTASHVLHHSIPLMVALVALIYHGVFDRFPDLRVGFMEGGCGWISFLLDRMERDENYFDAADQPARRPIEYLQGGRILIGCEGSEGSLAYVASRVGIEAFAYASDYPHEVDLVDAIREIEEVADRPDLTESDKEAVLGGNAVRFFGL